LRAAYSANHVREAACDFLRNHFSVSIDKDEVDFLALTWERDVIRRYAFAPFTEALEASARHAAMLVYLDNHISRRPPTAAELKQIEAQTRRETKSRDRAKEAVEIAKQRGLNENYARELMELHTLGVDRYYTQRDVISLAKALTGWTIRRDGPQKLEFLFDGEMHCQENAPFLGGTISGKRDVSGAEFALEALKRHPGTAHFLAWKLCRWFVNDDPDEKMVKRIAGVFQRTGGDLRKVILAIVEDPDFFKRENYRAKFKRPWEFVVSALRATGADVTDYAGLHDALTAMNEPLYRCPDPTGYYDQAEAWRDPGAMAVRWTFAQDLAAGRIRGAKIPASFYADLPPDQPREWIGALVRKLLPICGLGDRTAAGVGRLLDAQLARTPRLGPKQAGPMIVAVILGSPEFQKQ
jgi:uncharacterized protein (DUF1800 family)